MNFYKHNIGDYRRDTMHLSLLEHGIYRQLLDLYYLNECELNANALRLICARTAEEIQTAENILSEFFVKTETGWRHKRCDREMAQIYEKSEKAKASASARWKDKSPSKNKDNANALQTHSEGNATHNPLPITQDNKKHTQKNEFFAEVDREVLNQWLAVRKKKRSAAVSKIVYDAVCREAAKAGISVNQAITICVEKSWTIFDASWISKANNQAKNDQPFAMRSI